MTQAISNRSGVRPRSWFEAGPLSTMRRDLQELMENFLDRDDELIEPGTMAPRLDLSETDSAIEVKTDLPGMKPEEVNVELQDNYLVITAEHREETEQKPENGKKYHRIERRQGRYSRAVMLPHPVDESKIEAKLTDGVLTVTLPKTAEAQKRKITVNG